MEDSRQALGFLEGALPYEEEKEAVAEQPDFLEGAIPYEREVSPKAKEVAKQFRMFGWEPTPETMEDLRRKAGIALKEYGAGALGVPGDLLRFLQLLAGKEEVPEVLPTGKTIGGLFERLAGEEFRPETPTERFLEKGAGLFGTLTSPFFPLAPGRAALGALGGAGAGTLAEQLQAPPVIQSIAEILGTLAPTIARRGIPPITRAAEIARREAIKAPAAAIAERLPKRRLAIAKPTRITRKRAIAFEKSVEKAKDKIVESVTPFAKTEGEAATLKKASSSLYDTADKLADKIKGPVPTGNTRLSLSKNISKLEKTPALSTQERSTLKFLKDVEEGLEVKNTAPNLMALNKSLNAEINYLKPTGADTMLLDVKNGLTKDLESLGKYNPSFKNAWDRANSSWTEFKKSMNIRNQLDPIFTEKGIEFKKFEKLFTNPKKRNELTKLFGKDQYQRLKEISQLSDKGAEVFKELTRIPRFMRQLERFTNFGAIIALTTGNFKTAAVIAGEKISVGLMRGYYGRLMTDPNYQRHYSNLLKSLKKANIRGILLTSKKVNDDMEATKKDMED